MDSRHSIPPRQRTALLRGLVGLMAACGLGWAAEVPPGDGKQPASTLAAEVHPWRPFEPVKRPMVPAHRDAGANPVDAFLAQARTERGLKARPEASREALLRRVFMDLVGVNPTPVERTEFLKDEAPGAYERLVERLPVSYTHFTLPTNTEVHTAEGPASHTNRYTKNQL